MKAGFKTRFVLLTCALFSSTLAQAKTVDMLKGKRLPILVSGYAEIVSDKSKSITDIKTFLANIAKSYCHHEMSLANYEIETKEFPNGTKFEILGETAPDSPRRADIKTTKNHFFFAPVFTKLECINDEDENTTLVQEIVEANNSKFKHPAGVEQSNRHSKHVDAAAAFDFVSVTDDGLSPFSSPSSSSSAR